MTRAILRKLGRDSDAIVFDGPVNVRFDDGVIHFPTDRPSGVVTHKDNDDDIDLSGSFTPIGLSSPFGQGAVSGTFANCGIFSSNGTFTAGTAHSGVFTFPNGTQVVYSKCQVAQTVGG